MENNTSLQFLDTHGLTYTCLEHPAVYTCEEADALSLDLPGIRTKNLFLRNKKGNAHYLLIVPSEKKVDLKFLAGKIGSSKLSLASSERLLKFLGLTPGSVSILALVNDTEKQVSVIIDSQVWNADALQAHPLVNSATISLQRAAVQQFLQHTGHSYMIVDL